MRILPRLFSVVLLWGVVIYIVIAIDPTLLRDVGIRGLYLPFVILVGVAAWHTLAMLAKHAWGALALSGLLVLYLLLSITKVMYPVLGLGIVSLAGFIFYLTFIH